MICEKCSNPAMCCESCEFRFEMERDFIDRLKTAIAQGKESADATNR